MDEDKYIEALSVCVRCGTCKATCPVFNISGLEADSPRGRMRVLWALANGNIKYNDKIHERIFACLLCGECTRNCNPGIDLNEVFYHARAELSRQSKKTGLHKLLSNIAFNHGDFLINIYKPFSGLIVGPIKNYLIKKYSQKGLIPTDFDIKPKSFRNVLVFQPKEKIGRIALFLGCSAKYLYPKYITSLSYILTSINYEVVISPAESCCGSPFRSLGLEAQAVDCARHNYDVFKNFMVDAILSLCPTCVGSLKNYPSLIGEGLSQKNNIYNANEFIFEKFLSKTPNNIIKRRLPLTVVYHEPCHLVNKPTRNREILKEIVTELVEPKIRKCCGFGGTFSILNTKLSNDILGEACQELNKIKADAVVSACPGCVFQLSKQITDKPVYHIIELMEKACQADVTQSAVPQLD